MASARRSLVVVTTRSRGSCCAAAIDAEETDYLLATIARYFVGLAPTVVWSYAGIRPLYDDHAANASAVTRDYVLDLDGDAATPPLLSVFGGKITTHRRLAEQAMDRLAGWFPDAGPGWTRGAVLPGGDFAAFDPFVEALAARYPRFEAGFLRRLARAYGTAAEAILSGAAVPADLGEDLGGGLSKREVDHLVTREWARTAEDVLFRRSKLGLHVPEGTADRLTAYLAAVIAG